MNSDRTDWTLSPHAVEFLPEEIALLKTGAMTVCDECQWPHVTGASCDKCATYNLDRDRDCATSRTGHPGAAGTAR